MWIFFEGQKPLCDYTEDEKQAAKVRYLDAISASVQGTGIFVILYFILLFLLSCLLLQGVKTDIRGFMMPWVYIMYIGKNYYF